MDSISRRVTMDWMMDHIVLNVVDVDTAMAFYTEVLGLAPERWDDFRAGDAPFPSVRLNSATIIDLFPKSMWSGEAPAPAQATNLNHFCVTLTRPDWDALRERLVAHGVAVETGPSLGGVPAAPAPPSISEIPRAIRSRRVIMRTPTEPRLQVAIRFATEMDAEKICALYNAYVADIRMGTDISNSLEFGEKGG
jgi:catechol 2,3-dioxygenase-like lactoylglutathione lyase family enzyme